MMTPMTPKQIVKALREAKILQQDVARVAGVSAQMVHQTIHGIRTGAKVRPWIARLLRRPEADIFPPGRPTGRPKKQN
jgi:transcriptional regulator with XRE-family HTH domain